MKDLLEQKKSPEKVVAVSPMLLMFQAEQLKNRGCGSGDYNYVEYYRDKDGNIYGFLDEVVITPEGGYTEDYDWNIDNWGEGYPDFDLYDGSGGNDGDNISTASAENNIEKGKLFVDSLQKGDLNVTLSPDLLSNLAQVGDVVGFTNDVIETLKGSTPILGTIGAWLSRYALGYSAVSVFMDLTDGESSLRDWGNLGATVLGAVGIWVPPVGALSFIVSVVAKALPGDQGSGMPAGNRGTGMQIVPNGQY